MTSFVSGGFPLRRVWTGPGVFLVTLSLSLLSAAPPSRQTAAASQRALNHGRSLYLSYCASCHGSSALGDGPAAEALRMKPTNLTNLASSNRGEFPSWRIIKLLGGAGGIAAHGGRQMPVWGPAFRDRVPNDAQLALRVKNLVLYLESIQVPQAK